MLAWITLTNSDVRELEGDSIETLLAQLEANELLVAACECPNSEEPMLLEATSPYGMVSLLTLPWYHVLPLQDEAGMQLYQEMLKTHHQVGYFAITADPLDVSQA